METLESIRGRLERTEELRGVVRTMKGLAAVHVRQYQAASGSVADYMSTVERGLQALLRRQPEALRGSPFTTPGDGGSLAVLFGSDQGLCGPFNTRIADHAASELEERDGRVRSDVVAVGSRAAAEAEARDWRLLDTFGLPTSVNAVAPRVQDLLLRIERARRETDVRRIVLHHNRPLEGASYAPRTVWILPVDPRHLEDLRDRVWPGRGLPIIGGDWGRLFASLVRQLFFVSIFRAFADSLAAENASRLAAMQSAERSIDERSEELLARFHEVRQSSITEELLDVVSGFEALAGDSRNRSDGRGGS